MSFQLRDIVSYNGKEAIVVVLPDKDDGMLLIATSDNSFGWPIKDLRSPIGLNDAVTNYGVHQGQHIPWPEIVASNLTSAYWLFERDLTLIRRATTSAAAIAAGCHCSKCRNYFPYTNQQDNFICWNCKTYPFYQGGAEDDE